MESLLARFIKSDEWYCCYIRYESYSLEIKSLKFEPAPDKVGTFYFKFTVSDDGPNADDDDDSTDKNIITESLEIFILNFNDTPVLPSRAITFATNGVEDTSFTFTANDFLQV